MTYDPPPIWGSGIQWGSFRWGGAVTSGKPQVFVSIDGELVGVANSARWRLGRSDWFDVLTPQSATVTMVGEFEAEPNQDILLSCAAGTLWRGYVDRAVVTDDVRDMPRTTISATDIVGRLGTAIQAVGTLYAGPTLQARWFPIGSYVTFSGNGDLVEFMGGLLRDYAPDVGLDIIEGPSTGSLPGLIDWYFDAPGPAPKKTLLELINQAEKTSNAMIALQPSGDLLVTMRAPSGLSSVTMVDLEDQHGSLTRSRGRDTVINRWLLVQPAYDDNTVLDTSVSASVTAYGERAYEISDYLCTTATHFPSAFRTALATPRWVGSATFPIKDLGDPALLLAPLAWVQLGGDVWQVMSVEHSVDTSSWTVDVELDASQDSLNGEPDPTPA